MGKERMLITGGHALEGQVRVSGGKNTAVAVIPATLLCDEPCTIENLPDIEDVHALADILTELGAKVEYEPGCMMRVDPVCFVSSDPDVVAIIRDFCGEDNVVI